MTKQIIGAVMALLTVASCHKKKSTTCVNTVTVTDGTGTYTECGGPLPKMNVSTGIILVNSVEVMIVKPDTITSKIDTNYLLSIVSGTNSPFTLTIQNWQAHIGAVGVYTMQPQDSSNNTYTENYGSRQSYECSSGTINVTRANSTNIAGTFTLNISNATGNKVITGTFNANQPTFFN